MLSFLARQAGVREMLHSIEAECALTAAATGVSAIRAEVLAAIARVPREEFVPEQVRPWAYVNDALPIGEGQTISQPFIVALMTELLDPRAGGVILEVGTGSGYQAAVLAEVVRRVYTLEIIPALARQADERLRRLGYGNVEVRIGDGHRGWPEHAPYDGIIVTAAASHIPPALRDQLRPGGRLVIPVGLPWLPQELLLVEKDRRGRFHTRAVLDVAFVPLTKSRMRHEPGEEQSP
jgi:protein-L-isoaspartate(D-aspartate) O-methyltransferase